MRPRLIAGVVSGLVLVAGCATSSEPEQAASTGPHDASAQIRPELMEVEPARAQLGEVVAVYFPQQTPRGEAFVLEEDTTSGWELRYFLVAGDVESGAAAWWTPAEAGG